MLSLLLSGYLFLLIFRPFEYWPIFGLLHIERVYMLIFMAIVFFSRDKRFIPSPINGAVVCFTLTLLFSGLFGISWSNSWPFIVDYSKYVVFYFMVILSVRSEEDFRLVLLAFVGVMFLYVGKSAWEFFANDKYIYRMGIKRMVGVDETYGDPNAFAASICYSLPLAWAMIRSRFENVWVNRFLWTYSLLALVAIMFTGSRSGMVTFILFLFLLVMGSSQKVLGILLAVMILVISWDYMPDDLQNRFLSTFSSEYSASSGATESAEGRTVGFKHGIALWKLNPVLGIGPNNFSLTWPGLTSGPNAHNIYGQLLGELGSVGACSFGFLLLMMYRGNSRIIALVKQGKSRVAVDPREEVKSRKPRSRRVRLGDGVGGNPARMKSAPPGDTSRSMLLVVPSIQAVYGHVALAILQIIALMLFKGWADHNLYRYTWLWLAALTILGDHFAMRAINDDRG